MFKLCVPEGIEGEGDQRGIKKYILRLTSIIVGRNTSWEATSPTYLPYLRLNQCFDMSCTFNISIKNFFWVPLLISRGIKEMSGTQQNF